MKKPTQLALSYDDIQLIPNFSKIRSRLDVNLESKLGPYFYNPILTAAMDTVSSKAMMEVCESNGILGVVHRFQSLEDRWNELPSTGVHAVAIGLNDKYEAIAHFLKKKPAHLCFDIANAGTDYAIEYCKGLLTFLGNNQFHGEQLIVGNVCTRETASRILHEVWDENGSNRMVAIKVGIGSGAVCETRNVTGFGVPQVTAILECRGAIDDIVKEYHMPDTYRTKLIADGGIKNSGDVAKALACGADFVMVGGVLAGTDEAPGEVTAYTDCDGFREEFKTYRGMASKWAQEAHGGSMKAGTVPEGISHQVPAKGPAKNVIENLLGGLR